VFSRSFTSGVLSSKEKGVEAMYETPDIIYEGELEVQAGSPVGVPEWDELIEEW
jgi:hypothetical protein